MLQMSQDQGLSSPPEHQSPRPMEYRDSAVTRMTPRVAATLPRVQLEGRGDSVGGFFRLLLTPPVSSSPSPYGPPVVVACARYHKGLSRDHRPANCHFLAIEASFKVTAARISGRDQGGEG